MKDDSQFVEVLPLTTWQRIRQILTVIAAVIAAITGSTAVSLQGCRQPPSSPPATSPSSPPTTSPEAPGPDSLKVPPDPVNAVCRIQLGNAGCSATVIGPRLPDGRWQLLTASHCVEGQPRNGIAVFRNGLSIRVVVQGNWKEPDVAWLVTELPIEKLPYTVLADAPPNVGDKVYHCGFGVDVPGNVEHGTVVNPDNGQGQTQYRLSVSSGDSGGGIALNEKGQVLSPVCCTTAKGRVADVWGGTVTQCRKLRPLPSPVLEEWTPIEIPIRMPG